MGEKRQSIRHKMRVRCELAAGRRRASGKILDISLGGLAVQTELELRQGAIVMVELVVPGREPVVVQAKVRNARSEKSRFRRKKTQVLGLVVDSPPEGFAALAQGIEPQVQPSVRRTSFVRE